MNITSAQFLSLLSTILKVVGTGVVAHGTLGINGAMWEQIAGGIMMIAPVVWDMFRNTGSAQVANVVAMANDPASPVQGVITTNDAAGKAMAAAIPGPVVVAGTPAATEITKA